MRGKDSEGDCVSALSLPTSPQNCSGSPGGARSPVSRLFSVGSNLRTCKSFLTFTSRPVALPPCELPCGGVCGERCGEGELRRCALCFGAPGQLHLTSAHLQPPPRLRMWTQKALVPFDSAAMKLWYPFVLLVFRALREVLASQHGNLQPRAGCMRNDRLWLLPRQARSRDFRPSCRTRSGLAVDPTLCVLSNAAVVVVGTIAARIGAVR